MITLIISSVILFMGFGKVKTLLPRLSSSQTDIIFKEIVAEIKSDQEKEDDLWCETYDDAELCFDRLYASLSYSRNGDYAIMRRKGQSKFIYCKKVG